MLGSVVYPLLLGNGIVRVLIWALGAILAARAGRWMGTVACAFLALSTLVNTTFLSHTPDLPSIVYLVSALVATPVSALAVSEYTKTLRELSEARLQNEAMAVRVVHHARPPNRQ